ncbi:MAG: MBOAT family protein [Alistipes sp.]|nr:MBOAT family protein [Alistipes sp.]
MEQLWNYIRGVVASLPTSEELASQLSAALEYDAQSPMTLAGGLFLVMFLIFGVGYLAVRRVAWLRTIYVTLFSLYFYYKLSGVYLLLLIAVALSDYIIGLLVARCRRKGQSGSSWVATSVVINLAILCYFKAGTVVAELLQSIYEGGVLDIGAVVIPAGVSFFVFQSIAYVVDISRGKIEPLRRFIDYLFLLSFFPKMFLGPLVKASEFIPQIQSPRLCVSREDMGRAVMLIVGGLFKYAVIAKSLGVLFVAPAFAGEMGDGGGVAIMAILGFTLQIYCDFSGYSDLAVGVALMLGFRLPDNFNAPYKSATITEFWRRWHISLSTWLRDYLYISLGGNRRGAVRTYLNLIITMLLGGLWHGVGICFLAWGALHGVALALHKLWMRFVPWAKATGEEMHLLLRMPSTLFTFVVVAFGWLLFTAKDMAMVESVLRSIAFNTSLADFASIADKSMTALVIMAVGYVMHFLPRSVNAAVQGVVTRAGFVGQWLMVVVMIWGVMQCGAMLEAVAAEGASLPMYAAF